MQQRPHIIAMTYSLVEEGGGPAPVTIGFVEAWARQGIPVTLIAADNISGRWLTDATRAAQHGYQYLYLPRDNVAGHAYALVRAAEAAARVEAAPPIVWSCGLWGAHSFVTAYLSRVHGWRCAVRPAGSLGVAARRRRPLKKSVYYRAVESHLLQSVAGIHCMSERERDELPSVLRARAFVAPAGVDIPDAPTIETDRPILGVLARVHPIKRHHLVLDLGEALIARGHSLQIEFAGGLVDPDYERELRARIEGSARLRGRVSFLGHIRHEDLPAIVGRWRAALLLSEQENFGHSVVTAASMGIPNILAAGVGIAPDVARAGAGVIADLANLVAQAEPLLAPIDPSLRERCLAFARTYGWDACATELLDKLVAMPSRRL